MSSLRLAFPFAQELHRSLDHSLRMRETRIERRINYARIAILVPGTALDVYTAYRAGISNSHYFGFVVPLMVVLVLYLGLVHWATSGTTYRWWVKYLTVTIDFTIPLSYYVEVMRPKFYPGMSIDAAMGLFVIINIIVVLESALRLDRWIIVYGTIVGAISVAAVDNAAGANLLLRIWAGPLVVITGAITYSISGNVRRTVLSLIRRDRLTRFLPKELVDMVESRPDEMALGGKRAAVTIMFSDIRGFTHYSENRDPEAVVAVLNEYFTEMSRVVLEHGGMIDKFVGDAIMAVFGAPVPRDDDAARAVSCALEMLEALRRLNERWEGEGKEPLRMGVALHTGDAVAGNVGSPERMDYTVIGDTVNLAARVEELNKKYGTTLLLTESTLEASGHGIDAGNGNAAGKGIEAGRKFAARLVGDTPIRGRERPIRIYTVGDTA